MSRNPTDAFNAFREIQDDDVDAVEFTRTDIDDVVRRNRAADPFEQPVHYDRREGTGRPGGPRDLFDLFK